MRKLRLVASQQRVLKPGRRPQAEPLLGYVRNTQRLRAAHSLLQRGTKRMTLSMQPQQLCRSKMAAMSTLRFSELTCREAAS